MNSTYVHVYADLEDQPRVSWEGHPVPRMGDTVELVSGVRLKVIDVIFKIHQIPRIEVRTEILDA